jgi:hypothetical protein
MFLPLASNLELQKETMKKIVLDTRSPEEKFLDEIKQEEMKSLSGGMMKLDLTNGQTGP